jgi:hypothetical protein
LTERIAAAPPQSWTVSGPLLCERFSALPGNGKATAMDKRASAGPLWLGMTGLQGDRIADRRFHGGPDRTLCHYPTQHYVYWAQRFPQLRPRLGLGAFGENLGSEELDEDQVCIGDRLRWGDALIEICQPTLALRSPGQPPLRPWPGARAVGKRPHRLALPNHRSRPRAAGRCDAAARAPATRNQHYASLALFSRSGTA